MDGNGTAPARRPATSANGKNDSGHGGRVYGVHRRDGDFHGETDGLFATLGEAERFAKSESEGWRYGRLIVWSRNLGAPRSMTEWSHWHNGRKVVDHGPAGFWRKTEYLPQV